MSTLPSQCRVLEAHDLRSIIKKVHGDNAELSNDYFVGLCARESVIHLFNFIKTRYIEMGDYKHALDVVTDLQKIAPDEYRLLFDAGVLYARIDEAKKAIDCLNKYIDVSPNLYGREEAQLLLNELLSV